MYGTSIWWVFCVPLHIRMLLLCLLFSTTFCVLNRQRQPFSSQVTWICIWLASSMSALMGFVEYLTATPRPSQTRERPPFRPLDDRGDRGGSTETATGGVTVECLAVHREIYAKERAAVKACVQTAKRRFYCEKIHSSSSSRQLFAVSSELLGKSSTAPLPSDIPRSDLPDRFC